MAEKKKWWESIRDGVKTAVDATKKYNQQQSAAAKTPTATVSSTQGQNYKGNNYANIGTWEVPKVSVNSNKNTNNMGLAPLYAPADRYLKEKSAGGNSGGNVSAGGASIPSVGGYSGYSPYVSPYEAQLQEAVNRLMNREPFSYDYMSDPLYQQYAKSYGIQGELARQDTLGDVASMTGGLPSSYAVTAAQQAQNSWNSALNDMIPALQDAAYQRWMGNYEADANLANMLTSLDSMAYDRYNTDRNYDLALQEANNQARQAAAVSSYSMPSGMSYEEMLDWGANNLGSMTSAQADTFMDQMEYMARLQELLYGGSGLLG